MKAVKELRRSFFLVILASLFVVADIYASSISGPSTLSTNISKISSGISIIMQGKILSFVKNKDYDLLNLEGMPSFTGAVKLDGTGTTQIEGIKEDREGNMYVTGGFTDSLTFNTMPSPTILVSSGGYNVFLAKYDASGNCLWVRTARGDKSTPDSLSLNGALCIAVDTTGNSYIGGGFVRTLSFIDGQNKVAAELSSADTNIYNFEFFVAKYNTNGDLLWAEGGKSGSHGDAADLNHGINGVTSIILDAQDLPYIGGRFSGGNFLGDSVGLEEDGDFFLAALDPDSGKPVWGWILGTPGEDGVMSLSLDVYGYINALGFMGQGVIAFPTVPETDLTNNNANTSDTFVAKFDVNGNCLWADKVGGDQKIYPYDISTDTLGNLYISGAFKGKATFGPGINLTSTGSYVDGFLAKYDFQGDCLWAHRFGGDLYAIGNRIAVDGIGNSFVFSTFEKDAVFGSKSQQNKDSLTAAYIGMVVAKYDSAGIFQWVKPLNGTGWGGISQITSDLCPIANNPLQISYSDNNGGSLLLGGDFNKQLYLDNYTLTAGGNARNSFIARLSLPKSTVPVELTSFSAVVNKNSVDLNWKTATEINNKGFEIEKKINSDWAEIGFVNGHGSTVTPNNYTFVDNNAGTGKAYYRLKQINYDGSFKYSNVVDVVLNSPLYFSLAQNYPNPFNPATMINYSLPAKSGVVLKIYNLIGQEVAMLVNQTQGAGRHSISFNAASLSSGIYIYSIKAGKYSAQKKMILMK